MELENLVRKGIRLRRPSRMILQLRPEVAEWFADLAVSAHCAPSVLMVGVLEDFYDQYKEDQDHA